MSTESLQDVSELDPKLRSQLDYLHKVSCERDRRREEWLSTLLRLETTYTSISLPLSLAGGIEGSPRQLLSASLLLSVLAILAGAVRLHAPVRTASRNADQVFRDTKEFRLQRPVSTPISRFEKACGAATQALSLLSALCILATVCCSSLPCLKSLLPFR